MRLMGIDYGIVSPAFTILDVDRVKVNSKRKLKIFNFDFYSISEKENKEGKNYYTCIVNNWDSNIDRYTQISDRIIEFISIDHHILCAIEGYSFGSGKAGLTFNIGENTGILKYRLNKEFCKYIIVQPKVLKKFATGNGNASKDMMLLSANEYFDIDFEKHFNLIGKKKPIYDLIDSLWLTMFLWVYSVKYDSYFHDFKVDNVLSKKYEELDVEKMILK